MVESSYVESSMGLNKDHLEVLIMANNRLPQSQLAALLAQMGISIEHFSVHSGLPLEALLDSAQEVCEQCCGIFEIIEKVSPLFDKHC
jgi:hypothetical protein